MKILLITLLTQIVLFSQVHLYSVPTRAVNNVTYSLVNDTTEAYLLDRTKPLYKDGDEAVERWAVINPPADFMAKQITGTTEIVSTQPDIASVIANSGLFVYKRPAGANNDWETNQRVDVGDKRIYNEKTYTCYQKHITLLNWNPKATLGILWTLDATGYGWTAGVNYAVNDSVTYLSKSYKCLQAHISQLAWTPIATLNVLWKETITVGDDCPLWVQPKGAHDAYNIGDCVTFKGSEYESLINANVWSPAVYPAGWRKL